MIDLNYNILENGDILIHEYKYPQNNWILIKNSNIFRDGIHYLLYLKSYSLSSYYFGKKTINIKTKSLLKTELYDYITIEEIIEKCSNEFFIMHGIKNKYIEYYLNKCKSDKVNELAQIVERYANNLIIQDIIK